MQVALPVFLLLGLILAFTLNLVGDLTEERLQRDVRQIARAIQLPVAAALEGNDLGQLNTSLASVFEISEVYGAYLFDTDGRRLVSFGSVRPSRRQAANRAMQLSLDDDGEFDLYEEISGRDVYSFFLPLYDRGGQPNGLLQVTRRRSDIQEELGDLNRWAWLGFSVSFLLALACLLLSHQRSIGKPLSRIIKSMQKVEAGDSLHRAAPQGPQELQEISMGLNTMLDAIQAAQEEAKSETREKEAVAEKLRHAETMAALGQISAGVAHELGAPLTVIDGRAHRLLRKMGADGESDSEKADIKELLAIREQVERMSSLVKQLLSFGRSSRATYRKYELSEIFRRLQEGLLHENQVKVLPGPDICIRTDLFSLEQALGNLLRNARQACPQGLVQAGWETDAVTGQVCIFVEDAGPGIDASIRQHLFDPFVTTKPPGKGSGMGLAIVQRVARDHRGDIRVAESGLGGARFELIIPVFDESEEKN